MQENDPTGSYMPPASFSTPRMSLRLLRASDAASLLTHFADPQVTRFMDIDPLTSLEEASAIIAYHDQSSRCRWGLFDASSLALVGTVGFHALRTSPQRVAEIGFDLTPALWGQGLMREVLPAVLALGWSAMRLDAIDAEVHPENTRCHALLEGLGFEREPESRAGLVAYRIAPRPAGRTEGSKPLVLLVATSNWPA